MALLLRCFRAFFSANQILASRNSLGRTGFVSDHMSPAFFNNPARVIRVLCILLRKNWITMTFPENENCKMPDNNNNKIEAKLTDVLEKVLLRAREDNRITSGVFDCADKLEQEPETIMLCLLPLDPSDDVSVSIQHKLIEAYCWENDINLIKVNCTDKFNELVNGINTAQKTVKENPVTSPSYDCTCVLVEFPPKGGTNEQEDLLLDKLWPHQVIQLPI